jgi:hypothetical protein
MAKTKGMMGAAVLALLTGLSIAGPAAACEADGATAAQIRACEVRLAQERAAEATAEKERSDEYADFAAEERRARMERLEDERRARIEATLSADAARYLSQVREILARTGSLDSVGDIVAFLDHQEESFKRRAAPWLYGDVLNPWTYPEDTGGEGTDTGGEGTDTGGEGTGTETGGGGTDTGGGTETGGGTPTPDPGPETDPPTPDDGFDGNGDGTDDGLLRVALAPFPADGAVWRCSNFRPLSPQEEEALGAIDADVSFLANQLVLRGQDGVERTLSVQVATTPDDGVVLVWPFNQAHLDAACPS